MLINLSDVLSEHHKPVDQVVPVEMTEFKSTLGSVPVIEKEDAHIVVKHVKQRELMITGECRLVLEIPCDRCLEPVRTEFELGFSKNVDLSDGDEQVDDLDEKNYIDGYNLDVEKLLYNEILIGWPMKILCSEDCKGICNTCGQNLNNGTCDCEDTSLDPRMSVIRDVFKNFKEV
ncbi:MAG: DUF177 domain-containing protein [Tyzzerella sp.]|nr:DUF177 domain-containing protein [Tyzzerella sp.]